MSNWIDTHLHQGMSPSAAGFRGWPDVSALIIISVDDAPPYYKGVPLVYQHHWFPMPEVGCPLSALYAAIIALDSARRQRRHVYLHCYAGVQRSRMVAECYRYLTDNTQGFADNSAVRAAQANGDLPDGDWVYAWLIRLGVYLDSDQWLNKGRLPSGLLSSLYLETGEKVYRKPSIEFETLITGPSSL